MRYHPAISKGQVAVITGGASGIGLAAARRLGEAGMRLLLIDVVEDNLQKAVEEFKASGIDAKAFLADVSSRAVFAKIKARADEIGEISLLMNNAACAGKGKILGSDDNWEQAIATNLMGPVFGVQTFLPDMLKAEWPCAIINTGSKQGITLPPGNTAYNVSKAGLKAFTESLAHDLLATKGRITAHLLIPGYTHTGLTGAGRLPEKPAAAWIPEQVIDFMLHSMADGDFYILCPDNEVLRSVDEKRIRWAADDIILNRPALSRWHPDFEDAFASFMTPET